VIPQTEIRVPATAPQSIVALPSQFSPGTFAAPHLPTTSNWLVTRGIVSIPVQPDLLAAPRLPRTAKDELPMMLLGSRASEWLQRWAIEGSGLLDTAWRPVEPRTRSQVAFIREVRLPGSGDSCAQVRVQVALTNSTYDIGLWTLADLAVSTQRLAEQRATTAEGVRAQLVPPDRLTLDEVEITTRAALETAAGCLRTVTASMENPPPSEDWCWGAHLWATRGLDEFISWPPAQVDRQTGFQQSIHLHGRSHSVG
jgi:hypothetical protein